MTPTLMPGVPLAGGPTPGGTLALLALVAALGYLAACVIWPHTNCPGCHGTGRHRSPSGKNWRLCRRCGGSGSRTRTGRRLWSFVHRDRTDREDRS